MHFNREITRFLHSAMLGFAVAGVCSAQPVPKNEVLRWGELPAIPDPEGFASPFAGVAGGSLLVAGGANFPGKRPWDGGRKIWYDNVYVLAAPEGNWIIAGRLPRPTAYGVSVTFNGKVICAGGGDAGRHFSEVFALTWDGRVLGCEKLPSLPRPCAFMCGALVETTFYLVGGLENPEATEALRTFWALDLATPEAGWRELPAYPGEGREQAVAAAAGDTFYVFTGNSVKPGADGKPVREYLHDAYAYTAKLGWRRLADMPRPAEGALSPAPVTPDGSILAISGDDGTRVHLDGPHHPGFPRDIFAYYPAADHWKLVGEAPDSMGNVPSAVWLGRWVAACGERRPGYRSNKIRSLIIENGK